MVEPGVSPAAAAGPAGTTEVTTVLLPSPSEMPR